MNCFILLGLPPAFDLDLQVLETAYFKAQRQYHPDRFVGKPPAERQQALQRSIDINNAYNTLKNPLSRAQYLLHLQGITVGTEADSVKPSAALLMESMELRERIADADDVGIQKLSDLLNDMVLKSIEAIAEHYHNAGWESMAQETLRLGYLLKAQEELAQQKKDNAMDELYNYLNKDQQNLIELVVILDELGMSSTSFLKGAGMDFLREKHAASISNYEIRKKELRAQAREKGIDPDNPSAFYIKLA